MFRCMRLDLAVVKTGPEGGSFGDILGRGEGVAGVIEGNRTSQASVAPGLRLACPLARSGRVRREVVCPRRASSMRREIRGASMPHLANGLRRRERRRRETGVPRVCAPPLHGQGRPALRGIGMAVESLAEIPQATGELVEKWGLAKCAHPSVQQRQTPAAGPVRRVASCCSEAQHGDAVRREDLRRRAGSQGASTSGWTRSTRTSLIAGLWERQRDEFDGFYDAGETVARPGPVRPGRRARPWRRPVQDLRRRQELEETHRRKRGPKAAVREDRAHRPRLLAQNQGRGVRRRRHGERREGPPAAEGVPGRHRRGRQARREDEEAAVLDDGPARQAGIKAGDIITKIDDMKFKNYDDFLDYIATKKPGDTVKLTGAHRAEKEKEKPASRSA